MAQGLLGKIGSAITGMWKRKKDEDVPPGHEPLLDKAEHTLWKNRLKKSDKELAGYFRVADMIRTEYLGPHDARRTTESTDVAGKPVNTVASFVHTITPGLIPGIPDPQVQQKRGDESLVDGAKLSKARLRDVFRERNNFRALHRCVTDSFWLAGFVHIEWQPKFSATIRVEEDDSDVATETSPEQARAGGRTAPLYDSPIFRHIPYKMVLMDTDASDVSSVGWIGWKESVRVRDLIADDVENNPNGIYHHTADLIPRESYDGSERSKEDKRIKKYTIYHVGRRPGEIGVLVLAGTKYTEIRHEYLRLGTRGFPIKVLELSDVGRLLSASPAQFWLDQHDAFNEFVAEMTVRARQTKEVVLVPKSEPGLKDKVENAQGCDVLEVSDPRMVQTVKLGGVAGETAKLADFNERMIDKISGVSDFQRGIDAAGSDSATEVMKRSEFIGGRTAYWQNFVNLFLGEVGEDTLGMLFEHQWQDVPVRVESSPGQIDYGTFSNTSVPGNAWDYEVTFDVSEPIRNNPIIRQKRTQDTLALVADVNLQQMVANEGKRISVVAALEDHLEAIGTRFPQRYILDLPDPAQLAMQQQQLAAQENQQMTASGAPLPTNPQTDNHQIHAQVHVQAAEVPAIAEHLGEHYAYLEMIEGQAPEGQAPPSPEGSPGGRTVPPPTDRRAQTAPRPTAQGDRLMTEATAV